MGNIAFSLGFQKVIEKAKTPGKPKVFATNGTLDAIRTRGLSLRRRTLYPAELRGRMKLPD